MQIFNQLKDWIANFLDHNKDMTASEIGHNELVEQVCHECNTSFEKDFAKQYWNIWERVSFC